MELQFYILIKKGIKKFKIVLAKKLSKLKKKIFLKDLKSLILNSM